MRSTTTKLAIMFGEVPVVNLNSQLFCSSLLKRRVLARREGLKTI